MAPRVTAFPGSFLGYNLVEKSRGGEILLENAVTHIISHTDLDGVTAAAVAWAAAWPESAPVKVTLTGYGEVDNLLLESLAAGQKALVLDLFCQRQQTVDELDRRYAPGDLPFLFDHHETTFDRYGNRPWAVVDTSKCAAAVYHAWLLEQPIPPAARARVEKMTAMVEMANDRDLWLGEKPDSRLWQALVTLCGPWGTLMRLAANPDAALSEQERDVAERFVRAQEERFARALERVIRIKDELVFVPPDLLEFGDVSDFCGLVLDRMDNPPALAAVPARRPAGDWAVSMRSRGGLAGRITGLLKDGRKVRGGGHGDAAALYFPPHYTADQIRESLLSALRTAREAERPVGLSLGDLLKEKLGEK
jgi:hypothetical protein